MKRSITNTLSNLDRDSIGYIAVLSFRYGNVCVKADPTSLLAVEEEDDGEVLRIENLAYVIVHDEEGDDDKIDLIPKGGDSDLPFIAQAVIKVHPEFRQSFEVLETEDVGTAEGDDDTRMDPMFTKEDFTRHFLRLTMPEVNEDRKKVLEDAVELAYKECKLKLDAANTLYTGAVTAQLVGEDLKTADFVRKVLEDSKKKYLGLADQLKADKLKEIGDAYQRYLSGNDAVDAESLEDDFSNQWKTLNMNSADSIEH